MKRKYAVGGTGEIENGDKPKARLGYGELQDLYSFSDQFYEAVQNAQERPVDIDESTFSDEELARAAGENNDNVDYDTRIEELNFRFDEQTALIDNLQKRLSFYQNEPSYQESQYFEDEPNYMMDFIQNNILTTEESKSSYSPVFEENSNLSFMVQPSDYNSFGQRPATQPLPFKTKSSNVNISNVSSGLSEYLSTLPANLQEQVLITSGNDSDAHVKGSKHYEDKALDLRFNQELYDYIKSDSTAKKYGISTLNPEHGTAKHIHIQIK